jgi:hypothetical protein
MDQTDMDQLAEIAELVTIWRDAAKESMGDNPAYAHGLLLAAGQLERRISYLRSAAGE